MSGPLSYVPTAESFCALCAEIIGEKLTGVYLHGSAAMGCYNPEKSDVDMIVVVNEDIADGQKRRLLDMTLHLHESAGGKGIEMSVVREEVCGEFVYPTPFLLHFSGAHAEWYKNSPADYISKMKGTDKDLAAHFSIIYHRGVKLCGKEIKDVFSPVPPEYYLDSIMYDVENAAEDILENPLYMILNLCRVTAYKEEGLILSKSEGGDWGLAHMPEKYIGLIEDAVYEYQLSFPANYDGNLLREFADYCIERLRN